MLRVGDVVKISKPYSAIGDDEKLRWFVFLGRLDFSQNPRNAYFCTTTTQIKKYKRIKASSCVEFKANPDSCFSEDCLLCLDEIESSFTEEDFVAKFNPEFKGRISDEKLKEIVQKVQEADLPKIVKDDILFSFRVDEIPTK